ncbi:MAG: metalloregulator ArsR/SmtB family transcription factor [Bacilli bacterium]|nr:metalloregulator ArsR/SmtB family transcription factor [Bacilli bacterium]
MNMPTDDILDQMESLLNVASDYTRLKIMYCISNGEKSVSEIVEEVGASQSLVSHQLKVLRKANLVTTRKEKTKIFYSLADDHVISLLNIVHEHVTEE